MRIRMCVCVGGGVDVEGEERALHWQLPAKNVVMLIVLLIEYPVGTTGFPPPSLEQILR